MSKSDIALSVRGVSKSYTIGTEQEKHSTLTEKLLAQARSPFRRIPKKTFSALNDVSFDVKKGEVVGIIGRNGAGKSTLLKILSRITEPTSGQIDLYGRIGSLLEVGTGFHPELTGRENIYLNGAILGMTKAEVRSQFDAIVDFSGVEEFLDTPVKRYSSGMYVRLAFAVAAHLNPEILIIDEVLAVGDAEFQKKCLGKMKDVASGGRTVLFVSHNAAAMTNLCSAGIHLQNGCVASTGNIESILMEYSRGRETTRATQLKDRKDRSGQGNVRITDIWFEDKDGNNIGNPHSGSSITIAIQYESHGKKDLHNVRASIAVQNSTDQTMFLCSTELTSPGVRTCPPKGVIRCQIEKLPLSKSEYSLMAYLEVDGTTEDWIPHAIPLSVEDGDFFGTGKLYPNGWQGKGALVFHNWVWPER